MKKVISLKCYICGNEQFSAIDESIGEIQDAPDETEFKCSDCGRITTKEQFFEENYLSAYYLCEIVDFVHSLLQNLSGISKDWTKELNLIS